MLELNVRPLAGIQSTIRTGFRRICLQRSLVSETPFGRGSFHHQYAHLHHSTLTALRVPRLCQSASIRLCPAQVLYCMVSLPGGKWTLWASPRHLALSRFSRSSTAGKCNGTPMKPNPIGLILYTLFSSLSTRHGPGQFDQTNPFFALT